MDFSSIVIVIGDHVINADAVARKDAFQKASDWLPELVQTLKDKKNGFDNSKRYVEEPNTKGLYWCR